MFPRTVPSDVLANPGRDAEVRTFRALEAGLDETFTVLWGSGWLLRPNRRPPGAARAEGPPHPVDGETDFIVAHAELGVLVIEVKGGQISRDGASGQWFSTSAAGAVHEIKDPVGQARSEAHALRRKVEEVLGAVRAVQGGHAVWFPHCQRPPKPFSAEALPDICLFAEDLDPRRTAARIRDALAFWRGHRATAPIGSDGLQAIIDLFAPSFQLRSPLQLVLAEDDRKILELSASQIRALQGLARNRRVLVTGGAGTGKTVLALEKARRLTREGFRVLLTCFNRGLADYLRGCTKDMAPPPEIATFHQLCYRLATKARLPLVDPDRAQDVGQEYFERVLPDTLLEALSRLDDRFDAIVVDEAQDFHQAWWAPLELLMADEQSGVLYVFLDDNQRIYRRPEGLPAHLVEYVLTENHRNTRRIHEVTTRFYAGEPPTPVGPDGTAVEAVPCQGPLGAEVEKILLRLRQEGVPADDVVVLTGRQPERSGLIRQGRIGRVQVTDDQDREPGKVLVQTIHAFKGLERPVVVVADVDEIPADHFPGLAYVGTSRARVYLAVVARPERLRELVPPGGR